MVDDIIMHFGTKGMKWGVRKDGTRRSTDREARKDAAEYSKAQMFYGQGAGTRRKLIKNTVEAKSKKDPSYKKAFDTHLANQDMAKRASQARGERKRKDTREGIAKTARGVKSQLMGPFAPTITALAVAAAVSNPKIRNAGINAAQKASKTVINSDAFKSSVAFGANLLSNLKK